MKTYSLKIRFLSILLILPFFLAGCGQNNDEQTETTIKKKVEVQQVVKQNQVSSKLLASGTVVPKEYSLIRSLTPGTIEYLAPVGSEVVAGQPLFSIKDSGVENNYYNSLNNFQQTQITSNQRIQQAELGVNNAKARLDLARVQYDNTVIQTEQNTGNIENSAIVAYGSAYNTLSQFLLFLNSSVSFDNPVYIYENILTAQYQFSVDTRWQFLKSVNEYKTLATQISLENLDGDLFKMHKVLLESKLSVDNTIILLQNAIPGANFTSTSIENDKLIIAGYQTSINQHLSNIISIINSVENIKITNSLAINNSQAQLDLAEIEYKNSEIALQNAKDGADLEQSISQSQFDMAAYSYNNLSMPSPFSGTILSHFVTEGEQVSVGKELVEIGNLSLVEISVDVDVDFAKAIKLGDEVTIDQKYKGIVSEIEPIGDLKSGKISVTVQSQEAGDGLVASSIAEVEFNLLYEGLDTMVIPIKSATIEASGNYVYTVEDGKIVRKNVTLGQIYGDKVSVVSGLEEGENLVILNGVFVSSGEEVEVIE
ncbi:HlyD family efflux transporter periplasmic adaptor subunit [Patescibacteria group bacterium]|nr:HlyD family efflux transporter periplasmic adaptor subunit [Patescibacteria group bacterium]